MRSSPGMLLAANSEKGCRADTLGNREAEWSGWNIVRLQWLPVDRSSEACGGFQNQAAGELSGPADRDRAGDQTRNLDRNRACFPSEVGRDSGRKRDAGIDQ